MGFRLELPDWMSTKMAEISDFALVLQLMVSFAGKTQASMFTL